MPVGVSPAETHAKIEQAFQQLFHGDGQEQRVYFETGGNGNGTLAYITDWPTTFWIVLVSCLVYAASTLKRARPRPRAT